MNRSRFNDARFNDDPTYGVYVPPSGPGVADRIGVSQPPGPGSNYPFSATTGLSPLIADFYLSYEDDYCGFALPLRLVYLYGFGQTPAAHPDGMPAPTHVYDLVIADANGYTVFDSTQAEHIHETPWGTTKIIVEWLWGNQVARIVYFTAQATNFATEIAPADAALDARTCTRLALQLRSLIVGGQPFTGLINLSAGYNVSLAGSADVDTDGGRFTTTIDLDGVPGDGLGVLDGCTELPVVLRTINEIAPTDSGGFTLQAGDCLRLQPPLEVFGSSSEIRTGVFAASGLTSEEAAAALELDNDCSPCCPCDYFVWTYLGLTTVWDAWLAIATQAEAVRDLYTENSTRWTDQLACRLANPLTLVALSEPSCKSFIGGAFCNMSQCCLPSLEIRITLQLVSGGVPSDTIPANVTLTSATIQGTGTKGEEDYAPQTYLPANNWPVISFLFAQADPQQVSIAKVRVCATCSSGDALQITMTAHSPDPTTSSLDGTCTAQTPTVPDALAAIWTAAGVPSNTMRAIVTQTIPLDPQAASYPCGCS